MRYLKENPVSVTSSEAQMDLFGHRRIAVVGSSGAGKTTLARELAAALELPHIELDGIPRPELRPIVERIAATDSWIIDGNYRSLRSTVWSRATALVWLNYSFGVVMRRALSRSLPKIWFSARTHHQRRRQYLRDMNRYPHLAMYRLDTPAHAATALSRLRERVAPELVEGAG